jgi:Amt family ammonium transporter
MINAGDTAWLLVASALVLLMTPGLAFFYGGMVRKKNVLSVLMQCFIIMCVLSLQWALFGYSLSFAPSKGFWGGFNWLGLNGVGLEAYPDYAGTIPHQAFMIFQAMFAIITPALIIGAFAERMKFSAFLIFTILWATLVYDPLCHWVWGIGGWLRKLGTLDFAGGTVVHINAGIAALVTALVIGKRKNLDSNAPHPHNLPFVVLGTGLLWFGWLRNGKPTIFGTASGVVAGLVAITPAAGFVSVIPAIVIGLLVSVFCFCAVSIIKPKLGYDDSLDAFGVHCIGGIWGALATGLFASTAVNSSGANGLFLGNPRQLLIQLVAVLVTVVYTAVVTFIIYKLVDLFIGVRVDKKGELMGLDLTQHREQAYMILE